MHIKANHLQELRKVFNICERHWQEHEYHASLMLLHIQDEHLAPDTSSFINTNGRGQCDRTNDSHYLMRCRCQNDTTYFGFRFTFLYPGNYTHGRA